jgi:hypothetical protein
VNEFEISYIHTWKYNETPCAGILNKQKCFFSKTKNRKVKRILSWGWYQEEWGGLREGVKEVNMMEILCTHA